METAGTSQGSKATDQSATSSSSKSPPPTAVSATSSSSKSPPPTVVSAASSSSKSPPPTVVSATSSNSKSPPPTIVAAADPTSPAPSRATSMRRRKAAGDQSTSSMGGVSASTSQVSSSAGNVRRSKATGNLRASGSSKTKRPKDRHTLALESIRHFLKGRSSYDVLPVSFRLVVLDTQLVVGPALEVMWGAGVVSAPLWHSIPTRSSSSDQPPATTASASPSNLAPASAPSALDPSLAQPGTSSTTNEKSRALQKPGFAGMLTVNDIIHLIQYYYQHASYDSASKEVETFRLERLREIEAQLAVPPPPLLSCHPLRPLFEACQLLMKTHARRMPLLDYDEQTGIETVVSVMTQYRVLKFIAMNCRETASLHKSLKTLGVGTFIHTYKVGPNHPGSRRGSEKAETVAETAQNQGPPFSPPADDKTPKRELTQEEVASLSIQSPPSIDSPPEGGKSTSIPSDPATNPYHPIYTATLDTTVFDVVHIFSERAVSSVPILDDDGNVVDIYETVDVITLVRSGAYQDLNLTIRQALSRRPPDFPGVYSCSPHDSIANIFALLRKRRCHRLLIIEPEPEGVVDEEGKPIQIPDTPAALEEMLEKTGPRIRSNRGKLVGVLTLSDLLKHIIGMPPKDHPLMSKVPSPSSDAPAGTTPSSTSRDVPPLPSSTPATAASGPASADATALSSAAGSAVNLSGASADGPPSSAAASGGDGLPPGHDEVPDRSRASSAAADSSSVESQIPPTIPESAAEGSAETEDDVQGQ